MCNIFKLKNLIIISISILLFSCSQNNQQNKPLAKKDPILDADFACYKIDKVGDKLNSGVVFYPIEKTNSSSKQNICKSMQESIKMPFTKRPVILITHGWLGKKEDHYHQAQYLARMGMVAMVFTSAQHANIAAQPKWWVDAYLDMLKSLEYENSLQNSPVFAKIDTKNLSLMGHSMGGGGLFWLIDEHPNLKFTTIISLAPYKYGLGNYYAGVKMNSPILIVSGGSDSVAPPRMQENYYKTVPNTITKNLIKLKSIEHNDFGNQGKEEKHKIIDKYIQDWVKIQVYKINPSKTLYAPTNINKLKESGELVTYKSNELK